MPNTTDAVVDVNGTVVPASWKNVLLQTFAKSGPWALLCIFLLGGLGFELDKWANQYITTQILYLKQSSENISALQAASTTLVASLARHDQLAADTAQITRSIDKQMADAFRLMQGAPERSQQMIQLLSHIETRLAVLEDIQRTLSNYAPPPKPIPKSG